MIVERVLETKARKAQLWPVRSNRASEMGHPCVRYLTFLRTRGEERSVPSPELQMIFDLGNILEPAVIRDLQDAGFQVNQTQKGLEWKKYQITGSIDGNLIIDGASYPLEIKTSSPNVFNALNSVEDMNRSKYLYMRKYPTQLNLYMLMHEREKGVFIFKNKTTGAMKEIWMDLDYQLGEETLQKAELVNMHVQEGTTPEPIEWEDSICGECAFLHICTPDRIAQGAEIVDNENLLFLLNRRESLKQAKEEYEEVDKLVKESLKEKDKLLIGPWYVTGKFQERGEYTVKATRFWVSKIIKA